jgi:hypothetical protein
LIEKIREIVVEDFELSQIESIEKHMEEVNRFKTNVDSLSQALSKLQSYGVKSVISIKKEDNVIRVPTDEFIAISDKGEPRVVNTNSGKVGIMKFGDTTVKALLNDEQTRQLIAIRHPFKFWYSDTVATNLGEFYDALETVSEKALEHHFNSGDFSKWLFSIGEEEISKEFKRIEKEGKYNKAVRGLLRTKLLEFVEDEIKKRLNI